MRTNAAQVADLVMLIVAGDEGCLLQTEESIGAIEDLNMPVIVCINKIDVASREQMDAVRDEIRSYVALQTSPILEISGKTGQNLDVLSATIAEVVGSESMSHTLDPYVGPDVPAQGVVLESIVLKGKDIVLRVLLKSGVLGNGDHFVAGMIHGVVRSISSADSRETLTRAMPGTVVDVMYANKSKNVDAPIEFGFFVLPEARAKQVIEQRCVVCVRVRR
jgi:translation initiation factor IF-2